MRSRVWKFAPLKKCAKSSITQPRIDRSQSNLVHSLITWHPTYHTFSRSRGQRSRSQRDTTGAAADCPILLKFTTDDVTPDLPQSFKVKRSKVKVTALHNVLASKILAFHKRISWLTLNFVQIIPDYTWHMFKVIRSNIQIAITPPQIVPFCSNLVQSFTASQTIHCKCSRSKVKGQGHSVG